MAIGPWVWPDLVLSMVLSRGEGPSGARKIGTIGHANVVGWISAGAEMPAVTQELSSRRWGGLPRREGGLR